MGCPSSVILGNNLKFSICTHDPDTGVLTDASSLPTYRVYEDADDTAIANGSMEKIDDANTTGAYRVVLNCTAANGYEVGSVYTVYIEATVDGDTGGIAYEFTVEQDIWTQMLAGTDFTEGGTITFAEYLQITAAWNAGNWQLKTGETNVYELLDAEDGATVILEMTLSQTTPYRTISIQI